MYAKIEIIGEIEIKTGMHIGGSDAFSAIGAVDLTVVRDSRTNYPIIPGSSLKGKLRTLLARACNKTPANHDDDAPEIKRLFGSAKKDEVRVSRLLVSDMFVTKEAVEDIHSYDLTGFTEVKFENTINRLTAVANPRQIERVIPGTVFGLDMIYDATNKEDIVEDFSLLKQGFKLLQYDYLGGHGSRGYGKIRFRNLEASAVVGDIDDETTEKINAMLKSVEQDED